ncbi:probable ubiquitin-conjugating enzyme E2 25 [Rutidosis leptorrhynchoides]|uniref:probable ubiquitin-conjugating enzyme E2 25 n=1 Tax=Rutidosis leptorrhynchoides TaxID=125765 RepID=UPI003A99DE56
MFQLPKSWAKRIQEEWRILEKDLPDTIFVRVYESRMDILRAAIIGVEGTPYHDGLFFFDVYFPSSYPDTPPLVKYHSGGLRINPNLCKSGRVCLSLLNTWSGGQQEKWVPGTSTMLQVLVSIQGLILNTKPFFNEPWFAYDSDIALGEKMSLQYNEDTLILSLKTMVHTMNKLPKNFEELVAGHFRNRVGDILMACKAKPPQILLNFYCWFPVAVQNPTNNEPMIGDMMMNKEEDASMTMLDDGYVMMR